MPYRLDAKMVRRLETRNEDVGAEEEEEEEEEEFRDEEWEKAVEGMVWE